MINVTFDSSLPDFVGLVVRHWGAECLARNLFLRDASGRLTLVVTEERDGNGRAELSQDVERVLGNYVDLEGFSLATPEELFEPDLSVRSGNQYYIETESYTGFVHLLDRRVVGSDWLGSALPMSQAAPRLCFVSLKGGVGRSTALCVLAAHLASLGRRVLAVDLDLEAPGLGTMLLKEDTLPRYGVLDYLVESGIQELSSEFFTDLVAPSSFAAGRGVISVAPAIGALSSAHPENVLSKLARAYLPQHHSGSDRGFAAKIADLLDTLTQDGSYDAVLLDARAGLHESTAAAAIGLGGETLLFGIDQPQTYSGYKALFAQLHSSLGDEWRSKLHLVEARVGSAGPSNDFLTRMIDAMPLSQVVPEPTIPLEQLKDVFDLEWAEESRDTKDDAINLLDYETDSTFIYDSETFRGFDPMSQPDRLDQGVYSAVFENFIERCVELIDSLELRGNENEPD